MSAPTYHPASVAPPTGANGERQIRARERARARAGARERARERVRALHAAVEGLRQMGLHDARPWEVVDSNGDGLERVESVLGRAAGDPDERPAPIRAEIEEWVREEIAKAEERLGRDLEAGREELREGLAGLVDGAFTRRIEEAEAAAERRLKARALEFRSWAEQAHARAEEQITEMQRELPRRERRHELKLARQERDRRIAAAERRLAARGEALTKQLEQQAVEAERRIRALQLEVERRLDAVADAATSARARQPLEVVAPVTRS